MSRQRTDARSLFSGIAARYDRPAEVLSFGRYRAWRRAFVDMLEPGPGSSVLDVATGTGLIAAGLEARWGCRVTGLDLTEAMLRAGGRRPVVAGDAVRLPFAGTAFDAVSFSYLFRYVDDPAAVLHELVRVLRPGGRIGSVEFGMPDAPALRAGWKAYAHGVGRGVAGAFGPGWREVGTFLPRSIEAWASDWPVERQLETWTEAGVVDLRVRRMTLGAGVVIVGRRG